LAEILWRNARTLIEPCALLHQVPSDELRKLVPAEWDNLEAPHTLLTTLARECRHYNAVNGKVIDRSRQSVAELARTLSGTNADSTYTARGIQRA
jgi:flagellar biosynthesis/type III secretory pathway chaperone